MPRYKDGTEAQVGDLIRGKAKGRSDVMVGEVLHLSDGEEHNLRFFVVHKHTDPLQLQYLGRHGVPMVPFAEGRGALSIKFHEGETRAFSLIHRPGPLPEDVEEPEVESVDEDAAPVDDPDATREP